MATAIRAHLFNAIPSNWATIKAMADNGCVLHSIEQAPGSGTEVYDLLMPNGMVIHHYEMGESDTDFSDYKDNYHANVNAPADMRDDDGAIFERPKQAPRGWTYQGNAFKTTSAVFGSTKNWNHRHQSLGQCTTFYYDDWDETAESALTGTWTWDGTTTVLSTDTSGVVKGDWIKDDADGQWFEVDSVVTDTSVTILNPDTLTIPSGSAGSSKQDTNEITAATKALLGTWTWDGTTTVTTTDTSYLRVGDWIRHDTDGQWFEVSSITPNTNVVILNPDTLTIPNTVNASSICMEKRIKKTMVDFEPSWDYEVIGGFINTISPPAGLMEVSVVGVPDLPPAYGGTKEMVNTIDLQFMGDQRLLVDGRTTKRLNFDVVYHTNKLRFIFNTDAGFQCEVQVVTEYYKP